MFRRHVAITSLLLMLVGFAAVFVLLQHSDSDERALAEMTGADEEDQNSQRQLRQSRLQVRRDVLEDSRKRLHLAIFSQKADLFFDYSQKRAEEKLFGPCGMLQEEVFFDNDRQPQQIVRWFESETGTYSHQKHTVTAHDVAVARYQLPGHILPQQVIDAQPLMRGYAKQAQAILSPHLQLEAYDVQGSASTTSIQGLYFSFDGRNISLFEKVKITTPQVMVSAHEMHLSRREEGGFHQAMFSGDVAISLADGSTLHADHATIDVARGVAEFVAKPSEFVQLTQAVKKEQPETTLLCRRLSVFFTLLEDQPQISEMIAYDDVMVSQEGAWMAKGDVGTFKASSTAESLTGIVTLLALNQGQPCCIEMDPGVRISASQMILDSSQFTAVLHQAVIESNEWGSLQNHGQAVITFQPVNHTFQLVSIHTQGKTQFVGENRSLITHGLIEIDHLQRRAIFHGSGQRFKQVVFTDGAAEMHADNLMIDYLPPENQLDISKVIATGNVCLKGSLSGTEYVGVAQQYALCDTLEYWPGDKKIILSAKEGKVAILDKANGVAVSAPAIQVQRDPIRQKDVIKGIGDVRFSLLERDYQRLRERFNLEELPQ